MKQPPVILCRRGQKLMLDLGRRLGHLVARPTVRIHRYPDGSETVTVWIDTAEGSWRDVDMHVWPQEIYDSAHEHGQVKLHALGCACAIAAHYEKTDHPTGLVLRLLGELGKGPAHPITRSASR